MRSKSCMVLLAVVLAAGSPQAWAAWEQGGTAVCTAGYDQLCPRICDDGSGGAVMVWQDARTGHHSVYAQRVDALGNSLWTFNGVAVSTTSGDKFRPVVLRSDPGGYIVCWSDLLNGADYDVRAQRLTEDGLPAWPEYGIEVCTAAGDQLRVGIVPDGAGGAIMCWYDGRGEGNDIYAQRVNATGTVVWAAGGVPVCDAAGDQEWARMIEDGWGGAIIAWYDSRGNDRDVYAQRIGADGDPLWNPGGVLLCGAPGDQTMRDIVTGGGSGGAVVLWEDGRGGDLDIYAQKVDAGGNPLWAADGVLVCSQAYDQDWPTAATDGAGGAIIAWRDYRDPLYDYDLFAQRIDSTGSALWTTGGMPLANARYLQQNIQIAPDDHGGVMIAWRDSRRDPPETSDIYAQGLDGNGARALGADDEMLCTAQNTQSLGDIVEIGGRDAIVVWYDYRNYNYDIYAMRVSFGEEPPPEDAAPEILAVEDVPKDQGGWLSSRWKASGLDAAPDMAITHYSFWRRLPLAQTPLASFAGPDSIGIPLSRRDGLPFALGSEVPPDNDGPAYRFDASSSEYAWEWIENVPAMGYGYYALTVRSLYDSIGLDTGWQYFMTAAHTSDRALFYESAVDSGYSVDNLSPHTPCGLQAMQSGADRITLSWDPNDDPDIAAYRIYRSVDESFVPGPENKIGETDGTSFVDDGWNTDNIHYYMVSAVDVHGNGGPFALVTPEMVVATLLQSCSASVAGGSVMLGWKLLSPVEDLSSFEISRAKGRERVFEPVGSADASGGGVSFEYADRAVEPGTTYRYRVDMVTGSESFLLFESEEITVPAAALFLRQNHPNPFNPSTVIEYGLPARGRVTVSVFDVAGRLVAVLVDEVLGEGSHSADWDGRDLRGRSVSSGVYFYRIRFEGDEMTRKMVLTR